MKMTLLGTGTSHGVPVIGCSCSVCTSEDPRDNRLRSSAWVTGDNGESILVDAGPEFRIQAIKHKIKKLDAILLTHSHADHLHGLDDVRIFSHTKADDPSHPENKPSEGNGLPVYTNAQSIEDIKLRFDYIFHPFQIGGGIPKIRLIDDASITPEKPLVQGEITVLPVPLLHGKVMDTGWIFSVIRNNEKVSIIYLTDLNFISQSSIDFIKENAGRIEYLVIDGLRPEPHSTHYSFLEALETAEMLRPVNVYLTHITHNLSHAQIEQYVKDNLFRFEWLSRTVNDGGRVEPSYDGLELVV